MMQSEVKYTDRDHIESDLVRMIETGSDAERIAARMLRMQAPLLVEILQSHKLSYLAGFARGMAQVAASLVVSLPPEMREGMVRVLRREIDEALELAEKGPPKPP
jgi:hypothetical protein